MHDPGVIRDSLPDWKSIRYHDHGGQVVVEVKAQIQHEQRGLCRYRDGHLVTQLKTFDAGERFFMQELLGQRFKSQLLIFGKIGQEGQPRQRGLPQRSWYRRRLTSDAIFQPV